MNKFHRRPSLVSSLPIRCAPWLLGVALVVWQPLLHAQSNPTSAGANSATPGAAVKAELTQMLVVLEKGKEVLKPAKKVKPGDLIEYRVVYTNQSRRAVNDVQAQMPLPIGLAYQANSAKPSANAHMAAAGGEFAREPLMRDSGDGKKEPVPYAQYRQLRWNLGQLAAGTQLEVSARARVVTSTLDNTTVSQNPAASEQR